MDGCSGWITVTAVLALVWCVNADAVSDGATPMSCEVCGSDGEVERAFATERFAPCQSHSDSPPHTHRQCPPGNRACVTRLQAHGGKIVSKSCAERAVSGCHNINHDIYCYCTKPNCNINANLPIRLTPATQEHDHETDDDDDQEGSADGGGGRPSTRQPPVVTLVPPKLKSSGAVSIRQGLTGLVLWISVCSRTVFS